MDVASGSLAEERTFALAAEDDHDDLLHLSRCFDTSSYPIYEAHAGGETIVKMTS